jgi:hypothetical protein
MPSFAAGDIVARGGRRLGVVTDRTPDGGIVLRYDDPDAEGLAPPGNCDVLGPARLAGLMVVGQDKERRRREAERQVLMAKRAEGAERSAWQASDAGRAATRSVDRAILVQLGLFDE